MKLPLLPKLRLARATVIGCALVLWCSVSRPAPEVGPQTAAAEPGAQAKLDRLLKARYETAKALLDQEENRLREGVTTLGRVCEVARWVRDSAVELPVGDQERMVALTNYVALTRRLEAGLERAAALGAVAVADRASAHYLRLDAEIVVLRTELRDSR